MGSYEALRNALFRGVKYPHPLSRSMCMVIRAWTAVVPYARNNSGHHSPNTPLWMNPSPPEFQFIPSPAGHGVRNLSHICEGGTLQTFDQIKNTFDFPNSYFIGLSSSSMLSLHNLGHLLCFCSSLIWNYSFRMIPLKNLYCPFTGHYSRLYIMDWKAFIASGWWSCRSWTRKTRRMCGRFPSLTSYPLEQWFSTPGSYALYTR